MGNRRCRPTRPGILTGLFPANLSGHDRGCKRKMISWLKLDINILDDAKIKIIRSHPDGNAIIVLWIGLLCLAMKSQRPGIIEISNALPYTLDDVSHLFNIDKKTCELGLMLFQKYKMVDLCEDGTIEIINFSKHQKLEEIKHKQELTRQRVERYRARQRNCNALLTHNSVTVTLTDKDIDKEKEILSGKPNNGIPVKEIIAHLNEKTGKSFSPTTKETIRHIKARMNDGFSLQDFISVIDTMTTKWRGDPKMVDYLRPQTLFGTKFESYLNTKQTNSKADPFKD